MPDGAKQERWKRGAKAYSDKFLSEKKNSCKKLVALASAISAANAINPIPGIDVSVDISIIVILFNEIRSSYGLSDTFLSFLVKSSIPSVSSLAALIIPVSKKEGVILLLKKFSGGVAIKEFSKYVPFVGQAIAASIGFGITLAAGYNYLDDCHKLAEEALKNNLKG